MKIDDGPIKWTKLSGGKRESGFKGWASLGTRAGFILARGAGPCFLKGTFENHCSFSLQGQAQAFI